MTFVNTQPIATRADAVRNREKILAAARELCANPAGDVSLAEISRRAGVSMATLYRNFTGRQQLLETLYLDELETLCRPPEPKANESAGDTLEAWIRQLITYLRTKRQVAFDLVDCAGTASAPCGDGRLRVLAAGRPLFDAAQHAGEIRDDLSLEQLLDTAIAIARIGGDADHLEPILEMTLDGLRPGRRHAPTPG